MPSLRGDVIRTEVKNELSQQANPKLLMWGRHEQKRSNAVMTVSNLVRIFQLIQS